MGLITALDWHHPLEDSNNMEGGKDTGIAVGFEELDLDLDTSSLDFQLFRDRRSIFYHLHLAEEIDDRSMQDIPDDPKEARFWWNSFRQIIAHVQILEGTHPEQEKHIPKPHEEAWCHETAARLDYLNERISELRERFSELGFE